MAFNYVKFVDMQDAAVSQEEHEEIGNYQDSVGSCSSVCHSDDIVDDPERTS